MESATNPRRFAGHSPAALLLLAAITLLGFGLRLYHLDAQGVWYDESFTVSHAGKPLGEMMNIVALDAVHPPLHYFLVHEWFEWIGYGSWDARMVSVLFGVAAIPLLFLLTRRFANTQTSLVAALLLAVSQMGVYFSQEARSYEMALCLSLVAALALLRMLDHPNLANTGWFVLAGSLLVYTHYYTAATLAAFGVYGLLFHTRNRRAIWSLIGAGAAIIVLFLPWLAAVLGDAADPSRFWGDPQGAQWFSLVTQIGRFANGKFTSIEASSSPAQILLVLAVFGLPVLAALYRQFGNRSERSADPQTRTAWRGFTLGALMTLAPIALSILFSYAGVLYNYRHASFAAPGMYLAVAIAAQLGFRSPSTTLVWTAVVTGLALVALRANYFAPTKPDYEAGFSPMADLVQPGDCLVQRPSLWRRPEPHFGLTSYYPDVPTLVTIQWDDLPGSAANCGRLWVVWDHTPWMNTGGRDAGIRERVAKFEQDWGPSDHFTHPDLEIWLFLNPEASEPQ